MWILNLIFQQNSQFLYYHCSCFVSSFNLYLIVCCNVFFFGFHLETNISINFVVNSEFYSYQTPRFFLLILFMFRKLLFDSFHLYPIIPYPILHKIRYYSSFLLIIFHMYFWKFLVFLVWKARCWCIFLFWR